MFTIYGGKTEFNQWDLEQLVTCDCLMEGDEVVFSGHGKTYETTAFVQDGKVWADVPNFMLNKAGSFVVDLGWGLHRHMDCRTVFNVAAKAKPEDYVCPYNIKPRNTAAKGGVLSWNDLTDKPFYEETVDITVVDNLTVEGEEVEVQVFIPMAAITNVISVDVIFDNTKYQDVDITRSGGKDWQGIWCGDYDTWEYPFAFSIESGGYDSTGLIVGVSNSDVDHTISIVVRYANIRHIDPKYLPEPLHIGEDKAFEPIALELIDKGLGSFVVNTGQTFYRICDYIPLTAETLDKAVLVATMGEERHEMDLTEACYTEEHGWAVSDGILGSDGQYHGFDQLIPEGVWSAAIGQQGESATLIIEPKTTVKPLDEKYMPILTSPSGIKFRLTVDDSGTVSAVEVTE